MSVPHGSELSIKPQIWASKFTNCMLIWYFSQKSSSNVRRTVREIPSGHKKWSRYTKECGLQTWVVSMSRFLYVFSSTETTLLSINVSEFLFQSFSIYVFFTLKCRGIILSFLHTISTHRIYPQYAIWACVLRICLVVTKTNYMYICRYVMYLL